MTKEAIYCWMNTKPEQTATNGRSIDSTTNGMNGHRTSQQIEHPNG
jgi:hypothetical protein